MFHDYSSTPVRANPPKVDEIEVSLFGPGHGECVLIHVGSGSWIVIDSCLDQRARRQPALHYLSRIGVDAASQVKVVLASHWHRDHVMGLSEVVRECVSADFWTSAAFREQELLRMTRRTGKLKLTRHNAFAEFHDVMERLSVRSDGFGGLPVVRLASAGKMIYRATRSGEPKVVVEAISPSDRDVLAAMTALSALVPGSGASEFAVREPQPNEAAIALRVQLGDAVVLLGSDLEEPETPSTDRGWTAAVGHASLRGQPATVFKVAHHGSRTGHCPAVWSELLAPNSHALITPFRPSGLPRSDDLQRLHQATARVYLAARVEQPPAGRHERAERPIVRGHVIAMREPEGRAGHIRLRAHANATSPDDWRVELEPPARRVIAV